MSKPIPTNIVARLVSQDWRRLGKSIASVVLVGLPMGLAASNDSEAVLSYSAQTSVEEASLTNVAKEPLSLSLRARNTLRSLASNIASLPIKVVGDMPLNWQHWVHPISPATPSAESDLNWTLPDYASLPLNDAVSEIELGSYHFDFIDLVGSEDPAAMAGASASSQGARVGRPILPIRAAVRIALGVLHQTDMAGRYSPKAWFHLGYEPLVDASGADTASTPSALFVSERPEHHPNSTALNSEREHASIASAQAVSWANLEQQPTFAFGRLIDPSRYQQNTLS